MGATFSLTGVDIRRVRGIKRGPDEVFGATFSPARSRLGFAVLGQSGRICRGLLHRQQLGETLSCGGLSNVCPTAASSSFGQLTSVEATAAPTSVSSSELVHRRTIRNAASRLWPELASPSNQPRCHQYEYALRHVRCRTASRIRLLAAFGVPNRSSLRGSCVQLPLRIRHLASAQQRTAGDVEARESASEDFHACSS